MESKYNEDDYLQLSGIQHFAFCRRQWALIHIENQWSENLRTVEGNIFHRRVHDNNNHEKRGDIIIARDISFSSATLGISGQCDVLEFHRSPEGIRLDGYEGSWIPYPIEYKKGEPKEFNADRLQLCGQAMCIEEMLCVDISEGALFYGSTRRREKVVFDDNLKDEVRNALKEMHDLYQRKYTPKVKRKKACNACSLKEICLPELTKTKTVFEYISGADTE